jgi:XTP/dITP diphosphohydrolase
MIGIADDSGLVVDALGGDPGIYSARYAGEHGNDKANNDKLLENMKGVVNRKAAFVCSIACVFPDNSDPIVVEGKIEGEILMSPLGDGGFGYDPLFWVSSLGKSLAEATPEEKNAISHRANALKEFAKEFSKRI